MLVPCSVESVRVHVLTNQHVVLLQAEGVRRLLPIWIGADQAYSIATLIAGITSERPLTHDLMVDMLTKIGAEITRVVVKDLVADDFGGGVFSSRGRHPIFDCDWSSDVCSSDLKRRPTRSRCPAPSRPPTAPPVSFRRSCTSRRPA